MMNENNNSVIIPNSILKRQAVTRENTYATAFLSADDEELIVGLFRLLY